MKSMHIHTPFTSEVNTERSGVSRGLPIVVLLGFFSVDFVSLVFVLHSAGTRPSFYLLLILHSL